MLRHFPLYSTASNITRKLLSNNNKATIFFSGLSATGGDAVIDDGGYRIHIFTSPGSFVVSSLGTSDGTVEYLVVAGGSGGGDADTLPGSGAGGGGAGGFRTGTSFPITATTYPITVGGGGVGGHTLPNIPSSNGSPSIFDTITAAGGGYGGSDSGWTAPGPVISEATPGGSGGGGAYKPTAGTGNVPPTSPPQGNPGGSGGPLGGGGGGAGAAGSPGPSGGVGGVGSPITWLPASYGTPGPAPGRYFAGGGGRGNASGGSGGGGAGVPDSSPVNTPGTPGTTNTGGGGGGGGGIDPSFTAIPTSLGGSGIVAIRYPI